MNSRLGTAGGILVIGACTCIVLGGTVLHAQQPASANRNLLWYRAPAPIWDHALPIGNGRLGAMVFGGANSSDNNGDLQASRQNDSLLDQLHTSGGDEHLQLNESSLWRGSRADRLNPAAHAAVSEIRKLLLESGGLDGKKISAAEKLAQNSMIGVPPSMPGYSTLGDLYLRSLDQGAVAGYRRQLDLASGIVKITYARNGVRYTREMFASVPDQVIVVRLSADKKGSIRFRAMMDRPEDFEVQTKGQNMLVLREGPDHKDAIRFAGEALLLPAGGSVRAEKSELVVTDADSVLILIAAATDFKGGPFAGGDPVARCESVLAQARKRSAEEMLARQLALYKPLFAAMTLHLGERSGASEEMPTDERIKRASAGDDDLGLQTLYFDFARYLLISSSRSDGLPANLQGIWAASVNNPWGSKWTVKSIPK